jgi:hypothetical protein
MTEHRIFAMPFAAVYPAYVSKAERKGHTKEEVDRIICWLTGYDAAALLRQIENKVVCGVRVEEVQDPLMQRIRQLDKLVDELAKGKIMEKILR